MKNVLLKFAGLFVERIPVDEQGRPLPPQVPGPTAGAVPMQHPVPPGSPAMPEHPQQPMSSGPMTDQPPVSVALRALVPQEHAMHLAQYGIHVIAAGGSVTSDQARGWGAQALVVSAECLGQDTSLLQQPQLPTVFIAPQPVMIPEVPGVVQVQEPLRASEVAAATREAIAAFAAARG